MVPLSNYCNFHEKKIGLVPIMAHNSDSFSKGFRNGMGFHLFGETDGYAQTRRFCILFPSIGGESQPNITLKDKGNNEPCLWWKHNTIN